MTKNQALDQLKSLKINQKQEIIRDLVIFGVSITFIVLFWQNNLLTFFILLAIYLVRSHFWYKSGDHIFFIISGLMGATIEAILVYANIYQYANPTLLNIPFWLPFLWGLGAVIVVSIVQSYLKEA